MTMRYSSRSLGAVVGAWALVASAGLAVAQDSKSPKNSDPVLSGPSVNDASIPGQKRSFSAAGKQPGQRQEARAIPPRIFMQALGVLRADNVGDGVRLSAGQEEMIRSIQNEFTVSMKAFRDAHKEEISAIRSQLGPEARAKLDQRARAAGLGGPGEFERRPGEARPAGKPDGAPQAKPADHPAEQMDAPGGKAAGANEKEEASKRRLIEIMESAPKPKDAQAKVMSVLNEPQKELVKIEIERIRKAAEQNRPAAGAGPDLSGLPETARRRLENLPPEQREEAIKRLREQRAQRKAGEARPAPTPDEVNVPAAQDPPKK